MRTELVRNHDFHGWSGVRPLNYAIVGTGSRLRRTDAREHPARAVFGSLPGFGSAQHTHVGDNAFRLTITTESPGDASIVPYSEAVGNAFNSTHVGPFEILLGVNDTLRITEAAGTNNAVVVAGSYNATTLATALKTAMEAAGASANTYTWTFNTATRVWTVVRAGGDTISILWSNAASTIGPLLGFAAVDDTGATTYVSDGPSPADVGSAYRIEGGRRYAFTFDARSSVDGNLVLARLVLLDGNYAITHYLAAEDRFQVGAASITFGLGRFWQQLGVRFAAPYGASRYAIWRIVNGSAGAHVLDWGGISLTELTGRESRAGSV